MSVWFEGEIEIACSLDQVRDALDDPGAHYTAVVRHMPGLKTVELEDQGPDFVTIRTNEGLMTRTNLSVQSSDDSVKVEFDEEYEAGSMVTTRAHFVEEFVQSDAGVRHRTVLTGVEAPGLLGFLYRHFGRSNIGNALLRSTKARFEAGD